MNTSSKFAGTKSIKTQLRATFAVLIVLPIIILDVYAYMVARDNLVQQTKIAMEGNADVIAYGIDNNVKKEGDVINFFSYETEFRKALENADKNPYALMEELNDDVEPLIWYYLSSDINISDIHIYSELLPQDRIGDFASIPTTEYELEWYKSCKDEYSAMWVMDDDGGVYIIKALLDVATSSKLIGMITLKVNNDQFFSVLNQNSYLSSGIYVLDYQKREVAHKETEESSIDDSVLYDITSGSLEIDENNFSDAKKYSLHMSESMSNGWRIYYYVNRKEISNDVIKLLSSVIVIALALFVISFSIASWFAMRVSKRIISLNTMANDVKKGNFEVYYSDDYKDEISELADSMTDMAHQLKVMVDEINKRNAEDLMLKESDIHYREWLFDFVVEQNNDILAVLNGDNFAPSFVTSSAEAALGIPMDEVMADIRNLSNAQIEDERFNENIRIADKIEESLKTGEIIVMDEIKFENQKTGEHLYYRGVVVSTIDDGGKRLAVALYDRTQEFRRNHQLQEALNAAETANKAKTSFLANMSHDFRTPMNAITGFNLLIEKHSEEPDKVREYTHKISLASQNLLSLLNDVLDMSKIESGKTTLDIKEMAIGLLLEEINSVISFQAKNKNQEYIVKVDDMEHDIFMGDKQRINEILVNILGNAVKYTPEGGRIEFIINESPSSSEGFNNVKFTIKDNGIGMKPEYKDRIFDAFSREEKGATKGIQGTGLGMAITKSLVELMGGTIRVESEEGKGSTFIVNLRLKVVDEKDTDFWTSHGVGRVLFIDGNRVECEQISNQLRADGVEVLEAPTGFGAISIVNNCAVENKPIDLIFVDQQIEDLSAIDIIKTIRGKDKRNNVLIIVMADDFGAIEDEARASGANELMQKPVFLSTMKQLIEDITKRTAAASAVEEVKNPLSGMKFLAAEDNDINADILIELMDMEGATVTRGINGQEVVEMFKNAKEGDYDMILMDIQMPIMNGYEAAAAIRALGTDWSQRIPIIAMTANAYADDVQQAFDAGMNAHVTKPIDIRIVERTILEFKQ